MAKFFEMISPSLKEKVAIFIFASVVRRNKRLEHVISLAIEETLKGNIELAKKFQTNIVVKNKITLVTVTRMVSKLKT